MFELLLTSFPVIIRYFQLKRRGEAKLDEISVLEATLEKLKVDLEHARTLLGRNVGAEDAEAFDRSPRLTTSAVPMLHASKGKTICRPGSNVRISLGAAVFRRRHFASALRRTRGCVIRRLFHEATHVEEGAQGGAFLRNGRRSFSRLSGTWPDLFRRSHRASGLFPRRIGHA